MADQSQSIIIAMAIGVPLMIGGLYGLRHLKPNLLVRVLIGVAMLATGALLIYPLVDGSGSFYLHPVRLGLSIALVGLGINQAVAPLRVAFGRAA